MNFDALSQDEQVELMRFLCSFAWADGEVQSEERVVLDRIIAGLKLEGDARAKVEGWMQSPPDMEGFDFATIPRDKRDLFTDAAFSVVASHGGIAPEEMRQLQMFMAFNE